MVTHLLTQNVPGIYLERIHFILFYGVIKFLTISNNRKPCTYKLHHSILASYTFVRYTYTIPFNWLLVNNMGACEGIGRLGDPPPPPHPTL